MAKYRINGKFVKFKEFVKANGLDSVIYERLGKKEKRVWSGLKTYEERIIDPESGRFIDNKDFLNNPTLKQFAKNNEMSVKQYVKENFKVIKDFFDNGNFPRTLNSGRLKGFILGHRGRVMRLKGVNKETVEVEKYDFLFWADEIIIEEKSKNAVDVLFNFEVRNFGRDAVYISYDVLYSEDPDLDGDEAIDDGEPIEGPIKKKGKSRKKAKAVKAKKKK